MSKIKLLILLYSIFYLTSCGIKSDKLPTKEHQKFTIDYLSGGKNAFIFKNILTQQMIANDLFDEKSLMVISINISVGKEYLSTSITKVASRELNELSIELVAYKKGDEKCLFFDNAYEAGQSFLLADSSANLSNVAAQNDIFIINSENVSLEIIDDLLSIQKIKCKTIE